MSTNWSGGEFQIILMGQILEKLRCLDCSTFLKGYCDNIVFSNTIHYQDVFNLWCTYVDMIGHPPLAGSSIKAQPAESTNYVHLKIEDGFQFYNSWADFKLPQATFM